MPDEDFETTELKERIEESIENALEAEARPALSWMTYLSLSTAIIAVLAAVAALESGSNSNDAILEKNEAVLSQSKASDRWAYYQAKGVKASIALVEAEVAVASQAQLATRLRDEAARYKTEQEEIEQSAHDLEAKVKASDERAERFLARHHRFAISVTLFQIAIALCAIAALMRRKPLWLVGLASGTLGLGFFVAGFFVRV
jgi:lipopolysaccharide export LptBFGC system permease protein LptF